MIGLVRAEWLKVRSVRSNIVLMVVTTALSVGLGALLCAVVPMEDPTGGDAGLAAYPLARFQIATSGFILGLVLIGVIGVQMIAQEYRFNTIRATFTAVPRRWRALVAKVVVLTLAAIVLCAALIGLTLAVTGLILAGRGLPLDLTIEGAWRLILGTWLLAPIYALMGYGVGMIVRHPAGAIVAVLAWPMVIETVIVQVLRDSVGRWMPYNAGSQVLARVGDPDMFAPWSGFAYFATVAVALCLIGAFLVTRRDA